MRVLVKQLILQFNSHIRHELCIRTNIFEFLSQNFVVNILILLHNSQLISSSPLLLQKLRWTTCNQYSFIHYPNDISQIICFVHIVSCYNNYSIFLVFLDHVPQQASCICIHARCGFIQQYNFATTNESNRNTEFSFLASWESWGQITSLMIQINISQNLIYFWLYVVFDTFDSCVKL